MTDLGFLKICALSPVVCLASPQKNAETAVEEIKIAAANGAQIIALPELFLSGSSCGDLFTNSALIKNCGDALLYILSKTKKIESVIVIGLPVMVEGHLCNCAAVIQKGNIIRFVNKYPLSAEDMRRFSCFDETAEFEFSMFSENIAFGGSPFKLSGDITFSVVIGNSILAPAVQCSGANVIINISAVPETSSTYSDTKNLLIQQTKASGAAIIYANAGFGESSTDFAYSGLCMIAENGVILSEGERFKTETSSACAYLDLDIINSLRNNQSNSKPYDPRFAGSDACPLEMPSSELNGFDRKYRKMPYLPQDESRLSDFYENILNIQASALAARLSHTGIQKTVIGLSGGLDSTLALIVIKRAMEMLDYPLSNVLAITLPGFGTSERTRNNALSLAKSLGISIAEIDITEACTLHMAIIGHNENEKNNTFENIQARERTQILMDISNRENAILVGTGDMSELALGWCTYNGDHMSMYSVNCGVPKTLVSLLVRHYADLSDSETGDILLDILDTPVSPELLPPDENGEIKQKTEDNLGPYEFHDFIMYYFVKYGFSYSKLLFIADKTFGEKYSYSQLEKWLKLFIRRFFTQQFKRSCLPDGPQVLDFSLSPRGGLTMPSDADFSEFID